MPFFFLHTIRSENPLIALNMLFLYYLLCLFGRCEHWSDRILRCWSHHYGQTCANSGPLFKHERKWLPTVNKFCSIRVKLSLKHLHPLCGFFRATVRVGEYETTTNPDCSNALCAISVKDVPILRTAMHPNYDESTFNHDIMVVTLQYKVNFTSK